MPTDKNLDYYETFGVKPSADYETIKKRYRKLVMIYHPDSFEGDKNFADEEMIKKINEAYETLSNPEKRKAYDKNHNTSKTEDTSYSDYRSAQEKRKKEERERLWKDRYDELILKKRVASSENNFINLAKEFRELAKEFVDLKGYQDTINRAKECDMLATKAKEKVYARLLLEKKRLEEDSESTPADFRKLAQQFREIGMDYQDARSLCEECIHIASIKELDERKRQESERQKREEKYRDLLERKESASSEDEYRVLADEFRAMDDYQEAATIAKECEKMADYYEALSPLSTKSYHPPISKCPYRSLAQSMKMMTQLSKMMCMSFQKTTGAGGFYKGLTQEEYNKITGFGQRLTERSNDLTWFLFGGEYKKSDGSLTKITPGIKSMPDEGTPQLEQLYQELKINNNKELRDIINNNPSKVEESMSYVDELGQYYVNWVNSYGIDAQEAKEKKH